MGSSISDGMKRVSIHTADEDDVISDEGFVILDVDNRAAKNNTHHNTSSHTTIQSGYCDTNQITSDRTVTSPSESCHQSSPDILHVNMFKTHPRLQSHRLHTTDLTSHQNIMTSAQTLITQSNSYKFTLEREILQ